MLQTPSANDDNSISTTIEPYTIQKELGTGKFLVFKALDNKTKKEVALKAYPSEGDIDYFEREEYVLSRLDHPNIITYLTSFNDFKINNKKMYSCMTLEYARYGDLFEMISTAGGIPERLARTLFHKLVEGVSYIHYRKFVHLDLKVDNLLLDENLELKITDFDLAQCMVSEKKQFGSGTVGYRAPEIAKRKCHNFYAADIYSMGIILFIMMSGYPPYNEDPKHGYDHFYKMLGTQAFWDAHIRKKDKYFYSHEFMDLIDWMLCEKPGDRPTIREIKDHSWYRKGTLNDTQYEHEMKKYLKKAHKL
jgi:serine/threonine protein kinase